MVVSEDKKKNRKKESDEADQPLSLVFSLSDWYSAFLLNCLRNYLYEI